MGSLAEGVLADAIIIPHRQPILPTIMNTVKNEVFVYSHLKVF